MDSVLLRLELLRERRRRAGYDPCDPVDPITGEYYSFDGGFGNNEELQRNDISNIVKYSPKKSKEK